MLSICIPTYNMAQWVGGAVQSALALGHPDEIEVVVVDNVSTDDTAGVLSALSAPNFRVVTATEHVGMAENWNRAVEAGTAPWVTVLSADDELLPEYFENLRGDLASTDIAVLSQMAWKRFGEWAEPFGSIERQAMPVDAFVERLGGATCISTSAFRRDAFEAAGGFDPKVGPLLDFDLFFRIAQATGFPIQALGVTGGSYYASRGATWASHEQAGDAGEMLLGWIALRRDTLGPHLEGVARHALAEKSRFMGLNNLYHGHHHAAAREFAIARECADGRTDAKLRVAEALTRLPTSVMQPVIKTYVKTRRGVHRALGRADT